MFDILAVPFGHVMRFIYEGVGSYGLSIILFTLLTQAIMLPFNWKQKKGMMDVQRIQPKLLELQKKYANNRDKYAQEVQKLYDEEGVSPFSGCLPMLLTLPIMMGLYYVVAQPLRYFMGLSADQISQMAQLLDVTSTNAIQMQGEIVAQYFQNFDLLSQHIPGLMQVDFNFLGLNLALTPSLKQFSALWALPAISGGTAFLQTFVMRQMQKRQGAVQDASANASNAMMNIMMPAMSIYFSFILPAGLSLYWISRNVFTTVQELILTPYFIRKGREKEAQLLAEQEAKKKRRQEKMAQQRQKQAEQAKGGKQGADQTKRSQAPEDGEEPRQDPKDQDQG